MIITFNLWWFFTPVIALVLLWAFFLAMLLHEDNWDWYRATMYLDWTEVCKSYLLWLFISWGISFLLMVFVGFITQHLTYY